MKTLNLLKKSALVLCAGLMFTACSSSNNDEPSGSTTDATKTAILSTYVNKVVVPTYKSLADAAIELSNTCQELKDSATQARVDVACSQWIVARKYWELSEAFLFGAAEDYFIDPHIDSWPLKKALLDNVLANKSFIEELDEDGAAADGFSTLGYGLLGFHAVEYVLFREGGARNVEEISQEEWIYCAAVAEDLAWQTIRLEASWAGINNVTAEKKAILEENELTPKMNYGETMINAGASGNTYYKTQMDAMVQIMQGATDISDEVGNTKITDPVNSGNVLDVESWYSWNSIEDFTDNIRSVRNAYYGSLDGTVASSSLAAWMAKNYASDDSAIRTALTNAISYVSLMPAPFRNHLTKTETNDAVEACNALMDALDDAIEDMQK